MFIKVKRVSSLIYLVHISALGEINLCKEKVYFTITPVSRTESNFTCMLHSSIHSIPKSFLVFYLRTTFNVTSISRTVWIKLFITFLSVRTWNHLYIHPHSMETARRRLLFPPDQVLQGTLISHLFHFAWQQSFLQHLFISLF